MEKKYSALKILFTVLFFGGLWGIVEATLGTILHLKSLGMYASSTTIIVPIAFMLMGACYKRSGTFRSVLYMGIMAASIKAMVCAIFHLSFNPVYYILLESAVMGITLVVMRPKEILSFKGLGTFIIANTAYLMLSTFLRVDVVNSYKHVIVDNFEKYVFMFNAIAILYTFAFGALLYGIKVLAIKYEWKLDNIKKIIYSPITASAVASAMVLMTFLIR